MRICYKHRTNGQIEEGQAPDKAGRSTNLEKFYLNLFFEAYITNSDSKIVSFNPSNWPTGVYYRARTERFFSMCEMCEMCDMCDM